MAMSDTPLVMGSQPAPEHRADPKHVDWVAAALALVTSLSLVSAVWLRYGPGADRVRESEHPGLGSMPPALVVNDAESGEIRVVPLGGQSGRVVWVTFWSASLPTASADLAALEPAWARLRSRSRFTMTVAAVESDRPELVRAARDAARTSLPIVVARPATRHAFGAEGSNLPLHVLIDENGRVAAVAHGRADSSLSRLADQAEHRLDDLEPLGRTRFAWR